MVAFRNLALLSMTALPSVIATVDFKDVYVQPKEIKPLTYSDGWHFENTDLIGGLLDVSGNLLSNLLDLDVDLDIDLGLGLGGKKKKPTYGHGVGIIGGVDGHYKKPTAIYHSSGKPFTVLTLQALCCAHDLSKHCNLLDCHINLSGYNKVKGGKKIYDHDFYIPKPPTGYDVAPVDIDVRTDGLVKLGVVGELLSSLEIEVNLLDTVIVDVNGKKKHRGKYSYKPSHADLLGLGLLLNIDLDVDVDAKVNL